MFRGVYTVLVTPFKSDGSVDQAGLVRNVEWQISKGIQGLVAVGSTGEFASMEDNEKRLVAETVLSTAKSRVPVIIGTSAEATYKAIEYTKEAKAMGAQGAMVLPSYYCKPSQEEIFTHFASIADAVDLPLIIYNNPGTTGVDIQAETVARMFRHSPNLSCIKECTGDIKRLRQIRLSCENKITLFCGWEDMAYESFLMGASGWVSVIGNVVPDLAVELFEAAYARTDLARGWKVYCQILPMLEYLEYAGKTPQTLKYSLDKMGLAGGLSRGPRLPLDDGDKACIDAMLKAMGAI